METTKTLTDQTLYFCEGTADKQYRAWVAPAGDGFEVLTAWGRRGENQQTGAKTKAPVDLETAEMICAKTLREKTAKGYKPGPDAAPVVLPATPILDRGTPVAAISDRGTRFVPPMLLNPIDETEAAELMNLDGWAIQPKFDGIRLQLHRVNGEVAGYARQGTPRALPTSVVKAMKALAPSLDVLILDGELVDAFFYAFDVLHAGTDLTAKTCRERLTVLADVVPDDPTVAIRPTQTATGADKAAFLEALREVGCEGACFKRLNAAYQSGRPNAGGEGRKLKFIATAAVEVSSHNEKRSVNMRAAGGIEIGSVTIPPNKAVPAVGAIIEVRYLYARRGGCLIQPVYMRVRDDVGADSVEQLQFKGEGR